MAQTAVTSNIHETLDAQLDLGLQNTFNAELLRDDSPDSVGFFIIPLLYLLVRINAGFGKDLLRRPAAKTKNIGEANFAPLVIRNIYTSNTCHILILVISHF